MAFFKFRKGTDKTANASAPVPSVETIRQRAKYRLAGASVLVLAGVIGLPLLFDKQPRPIAVDIPIEIPDKAKVLPLVLPTLPAVSAPVVVASGVQSTMKQPQIAPVAVTSGVPGGVENFNVKQDQAKASQSLDAANKIALEPAKLVKPIANGASAKTVDATRAEMLLAGQDTAKVAATVASMVSAPATGVATSRFVVQVGAFADNAHAREVRLKLERAGLKTYTQVADTKDGRRIRVRVGPFASKLEADKTAEKIKKLSLPAVLLSL